MEDICRLGFQDVLVADQLHPAFRRHCHIHGRPLGIEQPDAQHVRLAAPDHLRHDGDNERLRQLDAERSRGHVGCRAQRDGTRGRVRYVRERRQDLIVLWVQRRLRRGIYRR